MKLTHKLCGAALLAVVGVTLVVPNSTKADDGVGVEGKGEIQFTSSSSSSTSFTNSSGSGTATVTSGGETSDAHGFGISYVSNLKFGGKHSIVTSGENGPYWASKWIGNEGKADQVENSHFVNFEDVRNIADHKYEITAEITKEFTQKVNNVDKKLLGATLTYNNMGLRSATADSNLFPEASALKSGAVVEFGKKTPMVQNENTTNAPVFEKGYGHYTLYFGKYELAGTDPASAEKSIMLTVPKAGNTVIYEGAYQAGITWTMSATFQP